MCRLSDNQRREYNKYHKTAEQNPTSDCVINHGAVFSMR